MTAQTQLLTINLSPAQFTKSNVSILDCIINIICLTAGNSPQLVAEQILEACNPILRAVAPSCIFGKGDGLPI